MPDGLEVQAPAEVRTWPEPIAPWQHTVFMLAVLGLWAWLGVLRRQLPGPATPRAVAYTSNMLVEYLLAGSAIAGLYARRQFLARVFSRLTARRVATDVAWGLLVYLVGRVLQWVIGVLVGPLVLSHPQVQAAGQTAQPFSPPELALRMLFCLTAAVCEEFLVRGYLLLQVTRWFGNAAAGVCATALLFGCMHFYEGAASAIEITAMGLLYGMVAIRRGNLWAVILAHFMQDAVIGLVLYLRQ
jgi:membrane protease YdiL (CAAX protease family)